MDTIAFFSLPAFGHIRATLPIVEHLVQRGCRVLYFIDETHRDVVAASGAEVRVIPNYTGAPAVVPDTLTGFAAGIAEQTYRTLPMLVEQVQAEGVGLIMHDSVCAWGRYVAELTGLPSVRTVAILIGFDKSLPNMHSFLPRRWIFSQFRFSDWRKFRMYRRKLMRTFGLSGVRMEHMLGGRPIADGTIVFASKEFIPHSEVLDDRTLFIGASFSDTGARPFDIPDLGDRPLIYISLGTTFTDAPAFFRSCKEAFESVDAWVIMSIGSKVDPEELGPWPANFRVASYVPQLEILRKASVFVTQAGGCSVMEALWHGVPMAMWPLTFEHRYNAIRVEELGAGVLIKEEALTAEGLRDAAMEILKAPDYREAAQRLGDGFREAGGPAKAADWILERFPAVQPSAAG